jgi:hypothetical protein
MRALVLLLLVAVPASGDSLDDALLKAGMKRQDLGWTPRGWWARFPRTVPHKLNHFDDLFAEPLATIPFGRTMAAAARRYFSEKGMAEKAVRGSFNLYRFVQQIGVDYRHGGFRSYSANLIAPPTPLDEAILHLYRYAGRKTKFVTFGTESPYPRIEKDLKERASKLPPEVSSELGRLVLNIVEAHSFARLAFRKVDADDRIAAAQRIDLGRESVDALEFSPAVDDVAKSWDEASLWYAGLKCVDALDRARRALSKLDLARVPSFEWETPLGWIRVLGPGDDTIDATGALLIVDLGGNDNYSGPVGANSPVRLLGLCLDLAGNDTYAGGRATQGAGLCGVGVLLDASGDDRYEAEQYAQGVGQFGLGALLDLGGDDHYRARWSAQGCAYFGVGILGDLDGKDRYDLHADGQGFGGVGGVGILVDAAGDDVYVAEPDATKSGRPSYHSDLKITVSNAQGCAMGRRGDGSDGHSWAGGLGALIDISGNDRYTSGNWSMGTGYWFGTGLLFDGAGDDSYTGHVWSMGTGAHFCIGVFLDEGGNDTRVADRASMAFGHDFTHALCVDLGGNDSYTCAGDGIGYSINRSVAVLIDVGGDDIYKGKENNVPGFALYDKQFADLKASSTYWVDSSSIGLFLDIGGSDTYWGETKDGATWGDEPGSDNWNVRNIGVGMDLDRGEIDWRALPVKGVRR